MHSNFGIDLVNTIKLENPHLWTNELKKEITALVRKAAELEYAYAEDTISAAACWASCPDVHGVPALVANRRAQQIGLDPMFQGARTRSRGVSELIDPKKEKNFFQTRVIEYQTGGALSWD